MIRVRAPTSRSAAAPWGQAMMTSGRRRASDSAIDSAPEHSGGAHCITTSRPSESAALRPISASVLSSALMNITAVAGGRSPSRRIPEASSTARASTDAAVEAPAAGFTVVTRSAAAVTLGCRSRLAQEGAVRRFEPRRPRIRGTVDARLYVAGASGPLGRSSSLCPSCRKPVSANRAIACLVSIGSCSSAVNRAAVRLCPAWPAMRRRWSTTHLQPGASTPTCRPGRLHVAVDGMALSGRRISRTSARSARLSASVLVYRVERAEPSRAVGPAARVPRRSSRARPRHDDRSRWSEFRESTDPQPMSVWGPQNSALVDATPALRRSVPSERGLIGGVGPPRQPVDQEDGVHLGDLVHGVPAVGLQPVDRR